MSMRRDGETAQVHRRIAPLRESDRGWALALLHERWGSERIVTRGRVHRADGLPGLVAWEGDRRVGLLTYHPMEGSCEIVTLDALRLRQGIGRSLVEALYRMAQERGWRRIWVITTNDNLPAQAFYEHLGFREVAVYRGSVDEARRLKPEIPRTGYQGLPIRDEIEYEWRPAER